MASNNAKEAEAAAATSITTTTMTTTTATAALTSTNQQEQEQQQQQRCQCVLNILKNGMKQTLPKIDIINDAIQEVYGDDAAIFQTQEEEEEQDGNTNNESKQQDNNNNIDNDKNKETVLQSLMTSMLELANENTVDEMTNYMTENNFEQRLQDLERVVYKLQKQDSDQKQMEVQDQQSAKLAYEEAKMPSFDQADDDGGDDETNHQKQQQQQKIKPSDIVNYTTHQQMLAEKDTIQQQIDIVQEEIANIDLEKEQFASNAQTGLYALQTKSKGLDKLSDKSSEVVPN